MAVRLLFEMWRVPVGSAGAGRWGGRVNPVEPPCWRRISPASGSEHGMGEMSPEPHGRSAAENGRARSAAWVDAAGVLPATLCGC